MSRKVIRIVFFLLIIIHNTGFSSFGERKPILPISVNDQNGSPVDSAYVLVYDRNHNFVCEGGYTDKELWGSLIIENDSLFTTFGKYYLKISKKGYKSLEVEVEIADRMENVIPEIILVADDGFPIWWICLITIVVVGGGGFFIKRKRDKR